MEERKHIDVVAGAILRDGKVFGACRSYGAYAGTWEFAGGKVESGETDAAALVRAVLWRESRSCVSTPRGGGSGAPISTVSRGLRQTWISSGELSRACADV